MANIRARLKARLKTAYAFLLASLILFFLAVILDVFTWAWEGKAADIVQSALVSPIPFSVIFRYLITIFLTIVGVAVIFWRLSKLSSGTWIKLATALGIEHLFTSGVQEKKTGNNPQ